MKFSRMEKMPTRPSQELNLGLQQTRLVLYQLSYRDQAETQPERATSQPSCYYPPAPCDRHELVRGLAFSASFRDHSQRSAPQIKAGI